MSGTELDHHQSKVVNDINLKIAVNTQSQNSCCSSQYTSDTDRRVDDRPPWVCLPPLIYTQLITGLIHLNLNGGSSRLQPRLKV